MTNSSLIVSALSSGGKAFFLEESEKGEPPSTIEATVVFPRQDRDDSLVIKQGVVHD